MDRKLEELKCWYNGDYVHLAKVQISILDFGFIHNDATYEVMRTKNGKILNFDLHWQRLLESCNYFYFQPIQDLKKITKNLLEVNNLQEAFVWICHWRGTPESGSPRETNVSQNTVIYTKPYYALKGADHGFSLKIVEDFRRVPDLCYQQKSKNFGWIEFNLAQRKAVEQGYDAALLLGIDNYVTEGPGFGVCFIKNKTIFTPKKDCLDSITIKLVETSCQKNGITFTRKDISMQEAMDADEAFACSTSGGITPITRINDKTFQSKFTLEMKGLYEKISQNE